MARFEEFFKAKAKALGVKVAEEVRAEIRRLSNTAYPPASLPGQPPHRRSGNFRDKVRIVRTAHGARLVFWAPYSSFLLLGTKFMDPRPVHIIALTNVLKKRKSKR